MKRGAPIAILDYGAGNLGSVTNAFRRLGANTIVVADGPALAAVTPSAVVLPGVGAVGSALAVLRKRGFEPVLHSMVMEKFTPFLGICVGFQLMAEHCEEFGEYRGLGWIPGRVAQLDHVLGLSRTQLHLPHMGWNTIQDTGRDPLIAPLDDEHFYFVHSFAYDGPPEMITATCAPVAGHPGFAAAARRGNLRGVQFHPEKSSGAGERLLGAFLAEVAMCSNVV